MACAIRFGAVLLICALANLNAQPELDRAESLRTTGESELAAGKYVQAASDGIECARLFHQFNKPEGEAACWGITGRAEVYRARYPEAVEAFEKSIAIARANHLAFSEAAILNDLGNTRYFMGSYSDAHALYEDASRIVESNKTADWAPRLRRLTEANFAVLYQRLGQYERALGIYRRMENHSTLPPAQHAQMLANIGVMYRRLGDPYKAMDQYREAAALLTKNRERDSEIGIVKNTGIVLAMDLEDYAKAQAAFEHALMLATETGNRREIAQAHLYLAETLRRMHKLDEAAAHGASAQAAAGEIKSVEDSWKANYTLGRIAEDRGDRQAALAKYTEAIAQIESLRTGLGAASLRASFLGDKRNVYDGAIRVRLRESSPEAAEIFLKMEAGRARSLQDKGANAGGVRLNDVAAHLPAGTALLEYWISGREGGVVWISNGSSGSRAFPAPAEPAIAALTAALREGSAQWKQAANPVSESLLAVLADLPSSTSRLLIVPDGGLAAIPFEILPVGKQLLIERYAISYAPAASFVLRESAAAGWRWPWRRVLTAFADPALGAAPPPGSLYSTDLPPLPGARQEAIDIADIVGGKQEIHIGVDNRKTYLTPTNRQPPVVLHFATHAIADLDDPDRSRLVFSSPVAGGPADFLFAREISALNLTGTRLVTLAACDTEAGEAQAGEGVLALSRAFAAAGADATISTLWRVGDQSAAELMRRFYRRLADGEPAVDALRGAKLEFLSANGVTAHPRNWAAFVLNGDSGMRLPKRLPVKTAGAGAVLLVCIAWIAWSRTRTTPARTEPLRQSSDRP